jgi:predicted RNA-binding protein with PIN domain
MRYLVDAYNLLFRIGDPPGRFENRRLNLIKAVNAISLSTNLNITLVFDGAEMPPAHATRHHFDTIELVYTPKGLSADDFIISEVELATRPEMLTVVSSDSGLTRKCRLHRGHVMKVEDFLLLIENKERKKKRREYSHKSEEISNIELKRLLKIFEERLKE